MPTIRKRMPQRKNQDRLSEGFHNYLTLGFCLDGDEEFEDGDHAERIWKKCKSKIMAEYERGGIQYSDKSPGLRPAGYWFFDLNVSRPSGYYKQTAELIERGLLHDWEIQTLKSNSLLVRLAVAKESEQAAEILGVGKIINLNDHRECENHNGSRNEKIC